MKGLKPRLKLCMQVARVVARRSGAAGGQEDGRPRRLLPLPPDTEKQRNGKKGCGVTVPNAKGGRGRTMAPGAERLVRLIKNDGV